MILLIVRYGAVTYVVNLVSLHTPNLRFSYILFSQELYQLNTVILLTVPYDTVTYLVTDVHTPNLKKLTTYAGVK